MATYNHSSSYNRTYEKKVIEETPRIRVSHPITAQFQHIIPSFSAFPSSQISFGGSNASMRATDDSFSATIDVRDFAPEDLKVSVIGQHIVVEGTHPDKQDELGLISRSFTRKFNLPPHVLPEAVTSNLTSDGVLTIVALPPKPKEASPSRTIPIKVVTTPAASAQASPAAPSSVPSEKEKTPEQKNQ